MSLPPGFLDELRARVTLSSVVGRRVTWDLRKSNPSKGDWWAPCPFHQERTASFHVDDRKGFYYCFGCHAKGDALTFLKETGNVGFMEAVEELAREAGMPMPARDPKAVEKADRRSRIVAVLEEAVKIFRLQLRTGAAAAARDYLARRRLTEAALDRWEIGFAPDARAFLTGALRQKGIPDDLIESAGLAMRGDDGGLFDRFRGRIMFPIRDGRGRAISFGGRAMDPNARAKYLNGPETEVFDKGRTLYNLGPAREAAGKAGPLIVAEGYMDVIALVDAGFAGAVAPLGTAVTEDQLRLMWRLHPEPVIALDGDAAGLRAGLRMIDLALPLIEAGQGLRFALLPGGMDPDDLIRAQGAAAMARVIETAEPMARLLWRREAEALAPIDSPERRAALRRRLREATLRIADPDLRAAYGEAFRQMEAETFRPAGNAAAGRRAPGRRPPAPPAAVRPETKATLLARAGTPQAVDRLRETAILALCLRHPGAVAAVEAPLSDLDLSEPDHAALLRVILAHAPGATPGQLQDRAFAAVGAETVQRILSLPHVRVLPAMRPQASEADAVATLAEQLARLAAERAQRREIGEAEEDMAGLVDEGLTWRLAQAARARAEAGRASTGALPDQAEDRAALSAHLQDLIARQIWVRRRP